MNAESDQQISQITVIETRPKIRPRSHALFGGDLGGLGKEEAMSDEKRYVVGFMFSKDGSSVALIRKQKPAWQKGLLNGIGGKVEDGEDYPAAMRREFYEETGCVTLVSEWCEFCKMEGGENDDGGRFGIRFFFSMGDLARLQSKEEEKIEIISIADICLTRADGIENLWWLIGLAIDTKRDGRPNYSEVRYP